MAVCSEVNCWDGERLDMSKTKNTVKKSSPRESKTAVSTTPPSSAISEHSSVKGTPEAITAWLMSSAGVFPVKDFPSPGSDLENTTPEISGRKLSPSFARYDHDTRTWKTSAGCLALDISDKFSATFPKRGMMRNGACYPLPMSEPPTSVKGSGLWVPTPDAFARGATKDYNPKAKSQSGRSLQSFAKHADGSNNLGQLNPDWVEWLMGWPIGWTSLEPLPSERWAEWLGCGGWTEEPAEIPRTTVSANDRAKRLKALGNGQVPQCMAEAWRRAHGIRELGGCRL